MKLIERIHGGLVHTRRVDVLAKHLAELIPGRSRVIDVGCGDGMLAHRVMQRRPDLEIEGIDVLSRPSAYIDVELYDGRTIPRASGSFDAVMLVDVVHHAGDPMALLREAARVASRCLIIKDHTRDGWLAGPTLRVMDFVGNARHGVALPYNYWPRARWHESIRDLGLNVVAWKDRIGLYPRPAEWVFGRSLHFVALLERVLHAGVESTDNHINMI